MQPTCRSLDRARSALRSALKRGGSGRLFLACLAGLPVGPIPPAHAQSSDIRLDISYAFYELDSDTLPDLQAEMNLEGPQGFPAYTTWQVNWTGDCQISVTATITLPDLGPDADLTDEDVATFNEMLANLEDHERHHVDFGMGFARDVRDMGCQGDTASVLQEWLAEERQYDIDTNHGETEGAWLPTE